MDDEEILISMELDIQEALEKRFLDVALENVELEMTEEIVKILSEYSEEYSKEGDEEVELFVVVSPTLGVMVMPPEEYEDYMNDRDL